MIRTSKSLAWSSERRGIIILACQAPIARVHQGFGEARVFGVHRDGVVIPGGQGAFDQRYGTIEADHLQLAVQRTGRMAEKQRIAVIFGGRSPEHDISIVTGLQALQAVDSERYEAF